MAISPSAQHALVQTATALCWLEPYSCIIWLWFEKPAADMAEESYYRLADACLISSGRKMPLVSRIQD